MPRTRLFDGDGGVLAQMARKRPFWLSLLSIPSLIPSAADNFRNMPFGEG
jgi:hypothetical protein